MPSRSQKHQLLAPGRASAVSTLASVGLVAGLEGVLQGAFGREGLGGGVGLRRVDRRTVCAGESLHSAGSIPSCPSLAL